MNNRKLNICSFQNTLDLCRNDPMLKENISFSNKNQKVILQSDKLKAKLDKFPISANLYITQLSSFRAAKSDFYSSNKVCVLNFANFFVPGGGIRMGSSSQEECLCRSSTLYENISNEYCLNNFYKPHEGMSQLANDDLIYTPDVTIFKDDDGNLLKRSDWRKVDVITCAAPNVSLAQISDDDLVDLHIRRGRRIMSAAVANKCDTIILGAFGCGVFSNNPVLVATAYHDLVEEFKYSFRNIEFAIFSKDLFDVNYMTFKNLI